jgi:hypothetical protein
MDMFTKIYRLLVALLAVALLLFHPPVASAQFTKPITVINVIPNDVSGETDTNSEPSIAVNPTNTKQVVISSFSDAGSLLVPRNPYFLSTDGGMTWTVAQSFDHSDTTVAWSPGGNAPGGRGVFETDVSTDSKTILVSNSQTQSTPPFPLIRDTAAISNPPVPGFDLDQARINVAQKVAGTDRIYIGYNNLNNYGDPKVGGNGATASVAIRNTGSPMGYVSVTVDQNPVAKQLMDSPATAVASSGNTVYAAFLRFHGNTAPFKGVMAPNGDQLSDIVLVRDDNGGLKPGSNAKTGDPNPNAFRDLKTGPGGATIGKVIQNMTVPWTPLNNSGTKLGMPPNFQRLGGDISVAVNPTKPLNVALAFTVLDGAMHSQVHVVVSTDGGKTFLKDIQFSPPGFNSGLPNVAVSASGNIGLLYDTFDGKDLITHFARATANLGLMVDQKLSEFPANSPGSNGSGLYVGDYQGLLAVGNVFFGTFSASNNPNPKDANRNTFPDDAAVLYQRNLSVNGVFKDNSTKPFDLKTLKLTDTAFLAGQKAGGIPPEPSIDPYFFSASAVPEPSALALGLISVGLVALASPRCQTRRRSSMRAAA